jgi:hypothetical protein
MQFRDWPRLLHGVRGMRLFFIKALLFIVVMGCSPSSPKNSARVADLDSSQTVAKDDLYERTIEKLHQHYGDSFNVQHLPEAHRVVLVVDNITTTIMAGGFTALFESEIPGDPDYQLTRAAFETLGSPDTSRAFAQAFSAFPDSVPPADPEKRLELYEALVNKIWSASNVSSEEVNLETPEQKFSYGLPDVIVALNKYIHAHAAELEVGGGGDIAE